MAIIKRPPHDDGPVNAGEQRLLDFLSVKLPENFYIFFGSSCIYVGKRANLATHIALSFRKASSLKI